MLVRLLAPLGRCVRDGQPGGASATPARSGRARAGLGPRVGFERLVRSRTIPAIDDRPVWAIVCFRVKTGHRRRGVARALLEGAVAYARSQGAVGLEAYPVDRGERRIRAPDAYVGILRMFDMAGFRRIVATEARSADLRRWLVRLDL